MSTSDSHDSRTPRTAPTERERAALAWVERLDRGLSAAEEEQLERWLAADPRHVALFTEFEGTWSLMDRMQEFPAPDAVTLVPAASRRTDPGGSTPPHSRSGRNRQAPLRRLALSTLAAAAAVTLAFLGWTSLTPHAPTPAPFASTARTGVGEVRVLTLPDGSIVRLNTATSVVIDFASDARSIRLTEGEAHFTVAKDPHRPLTVSAAGVAVRAVGTAFNVRVRAQAVEVLVTEGRVRVHDEPVAVPPPARDVPSDPLQTTPTPSTHRRPDRSLSAGEALSIPRQSDIAAAHAPRPVILTPVEIERTLAWRESRLEFVSAPLSTMVEEFNRYNRIQLVIADPRLAAQHFGGNFVAHDPAGFVRVLETNFGVVAEQRDGETLLRPAP